MYTSGTKGLIMTKDVTYISHNIAVATCIITCHVVTICMPIDWVHLQIA